MGRYQGEVGCACFIYGVAYEAFTFIHLADAVIQSDLQGI